MTSCAKGEGFPLIYTYITYSLPVASINECRYYTKYCGYGIIILISIPCPHQKEKNNNISIHQRLYDYHSLQNVRKKNSVAATWWCGVKTSPRRESFYPKHLRAGRGSRAGQGNARHGEGEDGAGSVRN